MARISYQQALDYLYSFVDYSLERSDRYSADAFDLGRVHEFLGLLGNPHQKYKCLHITGTKGKGSVAAMIESCLRQAGYRTGLYTSPHLQRFTERIRVAGEEIKQSSVADLVTVIEPQVGKIKGLTTYELMTAIGFLYFAQREIDLAVVEVGLGGRLDATNVITPLTSVITSISYDHMHLLGNSLSDIAREKAGIIKSGIAVVSSPQQYEVRGVLEGVAKEKGSPIVFVGRDWHYSAGNHSLDGQTVFIWSASEQPLMDAYVESGGSEEWVPLRFEVSLLGYHQVINAATAYAALDRLRAEGISVSNGAIAKGFRSTVWRGRFEILSRNPILVLDSAHNRDSALKLRIALDDYFPGQPVTMIFGASEDKDIGGMFAELLPRIKRIVVTQAAHPRSAQPEMLAKMAREYGLRVEIVTPVTEALASALQRARLEEVILVAGSLFVTGEVLSAWENHHWGLDSAPRSEGR